MPVTFTDSNLHQHTHTTSGAVIVHSHTGATASHTTHTGTLNNLLARIISTGSEFETALQDLSLSSADSSLGDMTQQAIHAQMDQAVFELVSGAGKSLTDAMKGVSRKLG